MLPSKVLALSCHSMLKFCRSCHRRLFSSTPSGLSPLRKQEPFKFKRPKIDEDGKARYERMSEEHRMREEILAKRRRDRELPGDEGVRSVEGGASSRSGLPLGSLPRNTFNNQSQGSRFGLQSDYPSQLATDNKPDGELSPERAQSQDRVPRSGAAGPQRPATRDRDDEADFFDPPMRLRSGIKRGDVKVEKAKDRAPTSPRSTPTRNGEVNFGALQRRQKMEMAPTKIGTSDPLLSLSRNRDAEIEFLTSPTLSPWITFRKGAFDTTQRDPSGWPISPELHVPRTLCSDLKTSFYDAFRLSALSTASAGAGSIRSSQTPRITADFFNSMRPPPQIKKRMVDGTTTFSSSRSALTSARHDQAWSDFTRPRTRLGVTLAATARTDRALGQSRLAPGYGLLGRFKEGDMQRSFALAGMSVRRGLHTSSEPSESSEPKSPWQPKKRLSYAAMDGLRALYKADPVSYNKNVLAKKFGISHEAVGRIIRSKFRSGTK